MIRSRDRLSWRLPVWRWLTPEGVDRVVIGFALAVFAACAARML